MTLAVALAVNPSTCVELPLLCISEWPRGFNFVICLSSLVAFGEIKETLTISGAKHCSIKYCIGKENNVVLEGCLTAHLLHEII